MQNLITRRTISSTTALNFKRKYNPSLLTSFTPSEKLEWLWKRPDPVPLPKTITTELDDKSTFHAFVKRPPLYTYIQNPHEMDPKVIEMTLPPRVYDSVHGKYPVRELSQEEVGEIKRLRSIKSEDTKLEQMDVWGVKGLAERFQCSKRQISELIADGAVKRKPRRENRWRWWHSKKYQSAQIQYGPEGNHRIYQ